MKNIIHHEAFLLDTHVVLWVFESNPSLNSNTHRLLLDAHQTFYVSVASIWEISIKQARGKLQSPDNMEEMLKRHDFLILDISLAHALEIKRLPAIHSDPFDRMLIAQARCEGLKLMTRDPHILQYPVTSYAV